MILNVFFILLLKFRSHGCKHSDIYEQACCITSTMSSSLHQSPFVPLVHLFLHVHPHPNLVISVL